MGGNIILDPFSKKAETHELNFVRGEQKLDMKVIVFEGESEYLKETKKGDILNGTIVNQLQDRQINFFRDVLVSLKRRNPKLTHFIIR